MDADDFDNGADGIGGVEPPRPEGQAEFPPATSESTTKRGLTERSGFWRASQC